MKTLERESGSKRSAISKPESRVLVIQNKKFKLEYPFQYLNDIV